MALRTLNFDWVNLSGGVKRVGYHVALTRDKGKKYVNYIIDEKNKGRYKGKIPFTDMENKIMFALKRIHVLDWNGKVFVRNEDFEISEYDPNSEWIFTLKDDSGVFVQAKGINGFPLEFFDFLNILHNIIGVPYSSLFQDGVDWVTAEAKRSKVVSSN